MLDFLKSYKTYLSGLWKYRVSGLVATLICGVLGIILTVVLPGNYEATARAYVDTKSILQPLMQGMTVQPDVQGQIQMMARTLVSRPNLEAKPTRPAAKSAKRRWKRTSSSSRPVAPTSTASSTATPTSRPP